MNLKKELEELDSNVSKIVLKSWLRSALLQSEEEPQTVLKNWKEILWSILKLWKRIPEYYNNQNSGRESNIESHPTSSTTLIENSQN